MTPFVLTAITTSISALIVGRFYWRRGRRLLMGILLGALAGFLGTQATMVPLGYCALNPEHHMFFNLSIIGQTTSVNAVLLCAFLLIFAASWAFMLAITEFHHRWVTKKRIFGTEGHTPGAFIRHNFTPWIFLSPTIIGLGLFTYYPAVQNFMLGTRLVRRGTANTRFVCLDNFATLLTNSLQDAHYYILSDGFFLYAEHAEYLAVLGVSFFYTFFIVILVNVVGIAIALLASHKIRGAAVYRTLIVWPYAVSGVVVGVVFGALLAGEGAGFINLLLQKLGLPAVPFLSDPWWARFSVVGAATWVKLAFTILIYIAGLQAVPQVLLEAATIDGANAWQRFRNVKLPMLMPYVFFVVFLTLNYSIFDLYAIIETLTEGGPVYATTNLVVDVIKTGVENSDIGKAAALSIILLFIMLGLTYWQFRVMGRRTNYEMI